MTQTYKRDPKSRGISYEVWRQRVEAIVRTQTQFGTDDIADWRYVLDYEEGYTPRQTAQRAIKNAQT
jgi:hypothetical protein